MTNQEVAEHFVIRWNGGPLLPEYDSATTLTEATQSRARSGEASSHLGETLRHYSLAERQAIRALRQDGLSLMEIARRFQMPVRSVSNIVRES
jgi:DNA-directed RNA polymerase specialized sigma24 family protein